MLRAYIEAAMRHAHYEILPEEGGYYGEIPQCPGVYATADTLEECRNELEEVLEEWILLSLQKQLPLPVIDGIDLAVKQENGSAV